MRNEKTWQLMMDLVDFGAKKCGSFFVLRGESRLTLESDVDFYILESQVEAFEAKFGTQFTKTDFVKYKDEFTTGLYTAHTAMLPIDGRPIAIANMDDRANTIEVTVKRDLYANGLAAMWKVFFENPELFKAKIWKKSGLSREIIRSNISQFIMLVN